MAGLERRSYRSPRMFPLSNRDGGALMAAFEAMVALNHVGRNQNQAIVPNANVR